MPSSKATTMRERRWAPPPLQAYKPLIINVALTGAVPTKNDTQALPMTPEEIAADAIACSKAGASIVHIHVRDEEGRPVHDRALYERAIGPIRDAWPELIVCVTTSGRVDPDPDARKVGLELDPPLRPDMASLTLGSFNFPKTVSYNPPEMIESLLTRMKENGVKPELEVFEVGMINVAHMLIERGLVDEPPCFNLLLGSFGSAPAFVGTLAQMVERLPASCEWAAAGIGIFQRPMVIAGTVMGGNVRTGLEDSPRSYTDEPATNVGAVELAVAAARLLGRDVARPDEARKRLGLSPSA